jgi:signal peptidase I
MAPTLAVGDLVVVERSAGPVRRMDVIAVEDPVGDGLLVKRAVGLGGDTVGIEDGVLVVNGTPVCERAVDQSRVDGVYFGPVTVPAGRVFLLGDERSASIDSRDFGPLADSAMVGLVRVRLWPSPGSLPSDRC